MSERTEIALSVKEAGDSWEVRVHHGSGQFASFSAPDLERALEMAGPHIASLAQPDPYENFDFGPIGGFQGSEDHVTGHGARWYQP